MSESMPGIKDFELIVDPQPKFDLSPYIYMQFMEPLGDADGPVEAIWQFPSASVSAVELDVEEDG